MQPLNHTNLQGGLLILVKKRNNRTAAQFPDSKE